MDSSTNRLLQTGKGTGRDRTQMTDNMAAYTPVPHSTPSTVVPTCVRTGSSANYFLLCANHGGGGSPHNHYTAEQACFNPGWLRCMSRLRSDVTYSTMVESLIKSLLKLNCRVSVCWDYKHNRPAPRQLTNHCSHDLPLVAESACDPGQVRAQLTWQRSGRDSN